MDIGWTHKNEICLLVVYFSSLFFHLMNNPQRPHFLTPNKACFCHQKYDKTRCDLRHLSNILELAIFQKQISNQPTLSCCKRCEADGVKLIASLLHRHFDSPNVINWMDCEISLANHKDNWWKHFGSFAGNNVLNICAQKTSASKKKVT